MSKKKQIYIMHSSHLDLFWLGAQADCLAEGARIIDDALTLAEHDYSFHFLIESVRFLEYYCEKNPEHADCLKKAFSRGQFEVAGSYVDILENHFGGESIVRNTLYGKKLAAELIGIETVLACHPDLPGFTEQTPQILKKCGYKYYISARGFKKGARFHWKALDGSSIIMYDVPSHYAYYDIDSTIKNFPETQELIHSESILLGCSAGDLGRAGTFCAKENNKARIYNLSDLIAILNERYPQYEFCMANAQQILDRMIEDCLPEMQGEYPSRWGHHGSAMNVQFYQRNKRVETTLLDAEKLSHVCELMDKPIIVTFKAHPLSDSSGNGKRRRYWDYEYRPETVSKWIEFAWRLQITTEDHNFGGIEGAQTEFDRNAYQKAATIIGKEILERSLDNLLGNEEKNGYMLNIVNTLNWKRSEWMEFKHDLLDPDKNYATVDENGSVNPLIRVGDNWSFFANDVPSFGKKSWRIVEEQTTISTRNYFIENREDEIHLRNWYYDVVISKKDGAMVKLVDISTNENWAERQELFVLTAYLDDSLGGSEQIVDKKVLDTSREHVVSVSVSRCDAACCQIEVNMLVMNVFIKEYFTFPHDKKQMKVDVQYFWPGLPDVQLKMALLGRKECSLIRYGVPYGEQQYGQYLEKESLIFGSDEISYDLFNRYREVQGYFTVCQNGKWASIASNQSAYDFKEGCVDVLLARDVRNGAERDYRFTNQGETSWSFLLTSGADCEKSQHPAKTSAEQCYPMHVRVGREQDSLRSSSWLTTEGNAIVTVFAPSKDGSHTILRVYNPENTDSCFAVTDTLNLEDMHCVNMDETASGEPMDTLGSYEIKTIMCNNKRYTRG